MEDQDTQLDVMLLDEEYVSKTPRSRALYERSKEVFPTGVSYSIRYFSPYPFFTARAKGSKLYDVDENEYVDFWLGHTALILGHSPPVVVQAVKKQLDNGTQYGTCHELEVELAEHVTRIVPNVEMVRFTNSGTEANMFATRLARACTDKPIIAKFEGGWHGGYDALHVGVKYPFDVPESAGLTKGATQDTVLLPFNDLEGVRKKLTGKEVAAIFVEPVQGGGGAIPVQYEFLKGLREFCDDNDILLVFDEVITGFRLAPGGGQQYFGVKSDITVFGKILGGGFPIGALCGKRELMERIDTNLYKRPRQSFHGGTFAGNPITMTAGLATLKTLEDGKLIARLNAEGDEIRSGIEEIFRANGQNVQTTGAGSIFCTHFTEKEVTGARDTYEADRQKLTDYHLYLIAKGVFALPTHVCVLSSAHTEDDIEKLFSATEEYAKHVLRRTN